MSVTRSAGSTAVRINMGGPLGKAVQSSLRSRLNEFVEDETSPPILLYEPEHKNANFAGDWYGEHAGKWLVAASRAAARTGDEALARRILAVARFLAGQQEESGYLGTYAPSAESRFTTPPPLGTRSWDVWNHSYLVLGLLEAHQLWPKEGLLDAAARIVDLLDDTFQGAVSIAEQGNHHGLSSVVALDPVVSLYQVTGEQRYLDFALRILAAIESKAELDVVSKALAGEDASSMSTGKAYQLIWLFVGIAKLHCATGDARLLEAVLAFHENVRTWHLTLGGGPWGGIGRHSELFNEKPFFSPYGFVETCSAMAWIQLNRELRNITGEPRFAEDIEVALWNTILGAIDENGSDWSYFTFPNGRRNSTYDWACCKSSGAIALEEAPLCTYTLRDSEVTVNLYAPSDATLPIGNGAIRVRQETNYPSEPPVKLVIETDEPVEFTLRLRIPSWADGATLEVNGRSLPSAKPGTYASVSRSWSSGDEVLLNLPAQLKPVATSHTDMHHGQEVVRNDYLAATFGPLVLASGLIDGFKREETLHAPRIAPGTVFARVATPAGFDGPAFELRPPARKPIVFLPYYEAGGRTDGKWRLTWMQVAWQ